MSKVHNTTRLALLLLALSPCLSAKAAEPAKPGHNAQVATLVKKGIGKVKESDFHQAVSFFNEALTIDPRSYDSLVNRGWTFRQMGNLDRAITDYSTAISIQPSKPQVYLNRGWCQKRLGKYDEALVDFDKAIELDPRYINAYRNRGSLKLKMGDYPGAIADFNQLLSLDPDAKTEVTKYVPPELLEAPGKVPLDSKTLAKSGTQLAQAFKGTSIQFNESDLAKLNNRAARAIKTGEFATAIGILEGINKTKPDYNFARENLTTAYNNQGLNLAKEHPDQSAEQFRKALFYSPQQGAARNNLNAILKSLGKDPESDKVRIAVGEELRQKGDYKGAFVEYMEALRLNNGPEARQKISEVCTLIDQSKRADAGKAPDVIAKTTPGVRIVAPSATDSEPAATGPSVPAPETRLERIAASEATGEEDTAAEAATPPPKRTEVASALTETASDSSSSSSSEIPALASSSSFRKASPTTVAALASSEQVGNSFINPHQIEQDEATAPKTVKIASKEFVQESAKALSLNQDPVGLDKDTIRLKWHNRISRGDELFDQGNYTEAETEYKDSLVSARKLGEESTELADSLERLSRIFLVQKRPVEALSLLEQAYSLHKDKSKADDPALARVGKKVLTLRDILYPKKKVDDDDKEDSEEGDEKPGKRERARARTQDEEMEDFETTEKSRPTMEDFAR
ncbi:MAG: tetratricopeptide repeat protein [Candidatus Obscuribacterales bacterium]|nr:tetratricopeptide repeat protein [Candidatus Obscuribacterales bacterium]